MKLIFRHIISNFDAFYWSIVSGRQYNCQIGDRSFSVSQIGLECHLKEPIGIICVYFLEKNES